LLQRLLVQTEDGIVLLPELFYVPLDKVRALFVIVSSNLSAELEDYLVVEMPKYHFFFN